MDDDVLQRVSSPTGPASPGSRLRAARQDRGLSLEDVEAATKIRARYLEALEMGNYGVMPGGEPQVRGFLRRYASFLGIPPEEIIALYERETRREPEAPSAPVASSAVPKTPARPLPTPPSVRPGWTGLRAVGLWILIIALLLGAIALGVSWYTHRPGRFFFGPSSPSPATPIRTPAFPSPMVPVTRTPTVLPPTVPPTPVATPTFPVSTSGVTLTLEAQEHVWVRVTVDGFTAFEGMLSPGTPQTWVGQEMVIVETGNGAGVVAIVNGQPQGPLCGRGEVCTRGWSREGEIKVSR